VTDSKKRGLLKRRERHVAIAKMVDAILKAIVITKDNDSIPSHLKSPERGNIGPSNGI